MAARVLWLVAIPACAGPKGLLDVDDTDRADVDSDAPATYLPDTSSAEDTGQPGPGGGGSNGGGANGDGHSGADSSPLSVDTWDTWSDTWSDTWRDTWSFDTAWGDTWGIDTAWRDTWGIDTAWRDTWAIPFDTSRDTWRTDTSPVWFDTSVPAPLPLVTVDTAHENRDTDAEGQP